MNKKIILFLIWLCFGSLKAEDGWLRSTDGKWAIPQKTINLREGFEGEGGKQRFHAYSSEKPTLVWFEYFPNTSMESVQIRLTTGKMPDEFLIPADFKFKNETLVYKKNKLDFKLEKTKRYDMALYDLNAGTLVVSVWGSEATSSKVRTKIIYSIIDAFVDGSARSLPR